MVTLQFLQEKFIDEQIKPKRGSSKKALFDKNVMEEIEHVLQNRSSSKNSGEYVTSNQPEPEKAEEEQEETLTVSERVSKLGQSLTQAVAVRSSKVLPQDSNTDQTLSKSPEQSKNLMQDHSVESTIISSEQAKIDTNDENDEGRLSVADRVARLGQSLSHAVASRPQQPSQKPAQVSQFEVEDADVGERELSISDRIDKLGKRLDVKMAAPKPPKPGQQPLQEETILEISDEQEEKPIKVSDRLNLFEKKAEEEQRIFDEQTKMYERLSKSSSSNLKQSSLPSEESTFSPEDTPCVPRDIFVAEKEKELSDIKEQSKLYTAAQISSLSPQLQRAQLFAQETYEEVPYESAHPFNSGHLEFQTTPCSPDDVEKKMQDDLLDKEKSLSQDTETLKKNLNAESDVDKTSKELINEAFVKESVKSMKPSEQEAYNRLSSWVKETPELEVCEPGLSKEQIDVAFHRLETYPQSSMEVEFSTRTPSEIDLEEIAALQAQREDIAKFASTSKEGQTVSSSGTKQDSLDEVASIPASSSTSGAGCESIGGSMEGEGKDNRSSPRGDIEEEYNESMSKQTDISVDRKESSASEFQFISGPCVAADAAMCALSPSSGDDDGKSAEYAPHTGIDGIESWVTADGTVKRKLHKTAEIKCGESEIPLIQKRGTLQLETDDQSYGGSTAEASHDSSSPTLMVGVVGGDVSEKGSTLNQIDPGKFFHS